MFSLKQEVFHDVSLETHLKSFAGALHTLQTVGVNALLLVKDQPGFDPFRRWNDVGSAPAQGLQFLQGKIWKVRADTEYWTLTEASSTVIFSPPRSEVERTASSPPFLANRTRS